MSGVNKVILIGHVGKDPEVQYFEGGTVKAKFSLATSETFKNKEGNKVEQTEWHNIILWGKTAELAEKYVRKGNQLYIEGRIKTRSYGEDTNKKYITEIIGDQMTFLGKKDSNSGQSNSDIPGGIETNPLPASTSSPTDDLPF